MPILQNAKKALRVSKRRAEVNRPVRSRVKTMVEAVREKPTQESLSAAFSAVDRAVKAGLTHKNKAARLKSSLSKRLASVSTAKKK